MKSIVLAGGCFWGLQKFFDQFQGLRTIVGYANGNCENPSYQQVCSGSGHAEAIEIFYEEPVKLAQILAAYFAVINPTSVNRQGNDVGINYRTGIYYTDEQQKQLAEAMLSDLQKRYERKIAVELLPLEHFYDAEEYHQKYLDKNPHGYCHLPLALMRGHSLPTDEQILKYYPSAAGMLS